MSLCVSNKLIYVEWKQMCAGFCYCMFISVLPLKIHLSRRKN